ncbi:MAG: NADH-quinone oxidoreductase subunit M [Chloroflexota bacterium]|nr:NADH-quinone oxidoreductase subunit M [Chloroflexota bacterium]
MSNLTDLPILSILLLLPLLGGIILLFMPGERGMKGLALATTLLTFLISLLLFFGWQTGDPGFQFVESRPWAPSIGINYIVGVDGLSLLLVLLTTFLMPLVILFSWDSVKDNVKTYLFLMLILETAMLGVFVALDLILFFVFFEASLIPMYFLIGRWGGPRRVYAAMKFFIFTAFGSALLLAGILVLGYVGYQETGVLTFSLPALYEIGVPVGIQTWLFFAFCIAFAIKVPLFPFHTWLPDAHVEAPTAGSVILAGVLLKMGTYGLVRFSLPLFPEASQRFAPLFIVLAIIGILYGALMALVQKDVKSLVAYSSVAHLGFVVLGIFSLQYQGVSGSVLQMANHGLSTGALFLLVGFLYERRHTRMLDDFGGLWKIMPVFAALTLLTVLSSAGLPGLNGFVGEFTILTGAMLSNVIYAVLGTLGIILAAWYLLWAFTKIFQGPLNNPANAVLKDLNRREILIMVPLVIMFFVIGLFPNLFLEKINPSVEGLLSRVDGQALVQEMDAGPQENGGIELVNR